MSEKDLPRFLKVILNFSAVVFVVLVLNTVTIFGNHLPSVYRASKDVYDTVCIDSSGNPRNHMEEWTESTGSCDRRVCVSQSAELFSYEVQYDCPPQLDIFDTANCQYVSSSNLAFPDCCPEIQCTEGTAVNDTTPACSDLSPTSTCIFWKALTSCVDSGQQSSIYNWTLVYCRETCGYCTVSG